MAYLKNKHLANIKKWNLDLSKYKDGVYYRDIYVLKNIQEFRGFKETFGFEIKEITGHLSFFDCKSLTSVSNLPEKIGGSLNLDYCTSLTFIEKMPSVVKGSIYNYNCPFFEGMSELQIREKHGILKK